VLQPRLYCNLSDTSGSCVLCVILNTSIISCLSTWSIFQSYRQFLAPNPVCVRSNHSEWPHRCCYGPVINRTTLRALNNFLSFVYTFFSQLLCLFIYLLRTKQQKHTGLQTSTHKKLSYCRGTARCVVSVEILLTVTQQCRNYLYDKFWTKYQLSLIDPCDKIVL